MKKLLLLTLIGFIILMMAACNSEKTISTADSKIEQSIKIISTPADFIIYNSLPELEVSADFIVLAKYTGQRELNEYQTENGQTFLKNSISTVKIMESFKGDLAVNSSIQTFEPGFFQQENEYVTIEGYNLMNEAGDYILFLKKNLDGPVYTIVGMYQGKYDMNKPNLVNAKVNQHDIESEYLGENVEQFNKLKQEVLSKYQVATSKSNSSSSFEKDILPSLTFKVGNQDIHTSKGIYTWSATDSQTGETIGIEAQALAPFEIVNVENSISVDLAENIILDFKPSPLNYEIKLWDEEKVISTYTSFNDIKERGSYVIEIVGYWDNGRVTYVCALNIQ